MLDPDRIYFLFCADDKTYVILSSHDVPGMADAFMGFAITTFHSLIQLNCF